MRAVVMSADSSVTARIEAVLQTWSWDCRSASTADTLEVKKQLGPSRIDVLIVVLQPQEDFEVRLQELKGQFKSKLVVIGPPDPKRILHLLHNCGVDEYLNEEDLESEVEAMLRRSRGEAKGKVISVLSPSTGGGSSVIAANLSACIAAAGNRCALVDLNLSTGDLAALLDVKPKHSIADLARNIADLDELLLTRTLTPVDGGVLLLSAPLRYEEMPSVTVRAVSTVIALARVVYPYVVLDIQSSLHEEQVAALELSNVILLVFEMDFCSLRNVIRVLEYFQSHGVPKSSIRLIAHRVGQAEQLSQRQVETVLNQAIDVFLPEDRRVVIRSANTGIPFVKGFPRSPIAQQIERFTATLLRNL
ncbi:MAG: CpaE family protein [Planctomycetota bacterium]